MPDGSCTPLPTGSPDLVTLHQPVMLEQAVAGLAPVPGGIYIDCTFGRGGHSAAILAKLGGRGVLHAFDQDPEAAAAAAALRAEHPILQFHSANFSTLAATCEALSIVGRVNGVLFDLGVSSPQLDDASRGFSFRSDGPLDMRMNPTAGESAAQWLARADDGEIADVLWQYGDERNSRRIARRIVETRGSSPITTTAELAELILSTHRGPRQKIHPATRSFQAIRIHINRELEHLAEAITQAVAVLAPGGRLAVISFHSTEDRLVKRALRDRARGETPTLSLVGKAQFPEPAEEAVNPRSRSAVLRVAEKRIPDLRPGARA